jgi:ABC-type multidrug transport system ATPase subunit
VWRPDEGDVLVCGRSTVKEGGARAQIGYVPDVFAPFPDLTVTEMLALVAALKRSPLPERALLDRLGVASFAHQSVARLSAGQTRRAALVAGLIGNPWLLVLDEPTSGLDVDGVALLGELLRERRVAGLATLLATHDPPLAREAGAEAYDLVDGVLAPEARPTGA